MADGNKRMVAGFNHNVQHRGKAYHVQTEDSGLGNPRIITHLFLGGNIISSKKTVYADLVGAADLPSVVRQLMEEQHKEMLRNLVNGVYDELAEGMTARSYQPGQLEHGGDVPKPMHGSAPGRSLTPPPKGAPTPAPARPAAPSNVPPPLPSQRQANREILLGENLISEKSLDEVILSYLAEDLEEPK
jgi:hypothetical protein